MTYDVFTYNGELEMLLLRLNILDPFVDRFIIVEAKTTFSGLKKPLYFSLHEHYTKKWWNKIRYYVIDENYTSAELSAAERSPNTKGASHWKNEFLQKESITKALTKLNDFDTVYIGDVDEIWKPVSFIGMGPQKLKLKVYAYYLNNRSDEEFWGTLAGKWGDIRHEYLNHLRTNTKFRTNDYFGWHFTSMGGLKEVQRKLNDSYTTESYNTMDIQLQLPERHSKGIDYLGRNFTFWEDESEWPRYLQENREEYTHLLKSNETSS